MLSIVFHKHNLILTLSCHSGGIFNQTVKAGSGGRINKYVIDNINGMLALI